MRRKRSTEHPASRVPRPTRRIHDEADSKLPEIAGCPRCGASYRAGRWTWKTPPIGSYEHICPACERIEKEYPASVLHVEGEFARAHRDDLLRLIRNIEERESGEHPLKRIIDITEEDSGFAVTATDAKLAQTFGRALKKAFEGDLELPATTSDKENLVRVRWTRD